MQSRSHLFWTLWDRAGMLLVLAVLAGICALLIPEFGTPMNARGLLLSVSTTGMVACTMLLCLASGNFDLSVSSTVAFAGVVAAVVIRDSDSVALGITAAIACGALVGLVNGVVVAKGRINPLITTLATMQIVRGLAYIVTDGKTVGVTREAFYLLGNTRPLGIETPVWLCGACVVIFGVLLERTTFGRSALAVGGNEEAARLAGIPVDRVKITIFVLQGAVAAFAGVVLASRLTSGQPMGSQGFELEVISACVLGGVSLTGGVGRMSHVVAGVLILGVVQNAMNLQSVPTFYQRVISGAILLAAVLLDRIRPRS